MKIAIVDDELLYRTILTDTINEELLKNGIFDASISTFSSGEEFLESWKPFKYHIVFLDIYMAGMSGVEVAKKMREIDTSVIIIFCTTSNEFAAQSYEVDANYYLLKPLTKENIQGMLNRIELSRIQRRQAISLPDGHRCILYNIQYTDYSNHTVIFYLQGSDPHTVYMSHSDAETLLHPHTGFHTINKGTIVNFFMVERISKNAFILKNGVLLPISRSRFKEVSQAYSDFRFQQMVKQL